MNKEISNKEDVANITASIALTANILISISNILYAKYK